MASDVTGETAGPWLGAGACLAAALLAGCNPTEPEPVESLRYAEEYPDVRYAATEPAGVAGTLARRIRDGDVELVFDPVRGYLEAVLDELGIDPVSQTLVFSRTSLQTRFIHSTTPRAIFFNDENYVAFVPSAPTLEIASYDPELGPVFYTIPQDVSAGVPERRLGVCLRCHDTYGLSGGGVPRFLLGSGYTGNDGELVSHEAWILTGQATPLRSRWGGWYVSGMHGEQVHLGNIVVERAEDLQDIESLRVGNVADLSGLLDASPYVTNYSDIVALMVLEHQIAVQNALSRLRFESASATAQPLDRHIDALLREMFLIDEVELTDTIESTSGFREHFESLGPFDSAGRSLREFDLESRLFRYPLSYLIYSDGFAALPAATKDQVHARMREILDGSQEPFSNAELAADDRAAIAAILGDTLPEPFAAR